MVSCNAFSLVWALSWVATSRPRRNTCSVSAEIVNLRQVRGDQDDPRPGLQKFGEKLVDLDLGADVDAHRRLIEDEELGAMVQPFADDNLLLVTAGEARRGSIARRCLDLHVADLPVGGGRFGERVTMTMPFVRRL